MAQEQQSQRVQDGGASDAQGPGLFRLFLEDYRTHQSKLLEQGLWAVTVHRFGRRIMRIRPFILRLPFSFLYLAGSRVVQWMCGISIHPGVALGRRVRIWHHSGIVITARTIGDDVQIRQNTTIGERRRGGADGWPVIEDRVDIGCGACILGGITVGRDSVIGANAVVLIDVPPGSVAVGVPARVVGPHREPTGAR